MSLKVVIVTAEVPFYLPSVVQRIAERRARDIKALVILSPITPKGSWRKMIQRHLLLFGWLNFLRYSLRFVAFKIFDHLPNVTISGSSATFYSVRRAAEAYGVPVYRPRNINDKSFLTQLESLQPDVIVSIDAPQIFRKGILSLPKHGCINVHSALLPKYRGMLPSFWVLANNETETGVTVHYMDEELDNGEILLQRRVPIVPGETQHTLLLKTKQMGAELVLEALDQIERGAVCRQPNLAAEATYYSFPTAEDARRFRARGKRFW